MKSLMIKKYFMSQEINIRDKIKQIKDRVIKNSSITTTTTIQD